MYGLLTFWLCLATLAFLKRQWILFSISAALAQYTHNLAAFYLIPLALTPIFQRDWKTLRNLTLAGFASIIIYSPWLIQLPGQISKVTTNFWIERPGIEKLFTLFLLFLPHLPLPNNLLLPGLLLATLIIALAVFQTIQAKRNNVEKPNSGIWLAYLSFTPFILLWLVSQFLPIYVERALLPSHLIFCIWLAWAFTQPKLPRPIQILAFSLIIITAGMGFYQHITYNGFPYGPFKTLNESIQNRMEQGDMIIHSSKLSYLPSFYFDRSLSQGYIIDPPGSSVDTLSPATRDILKLNSYENLEKAAANAPRVWFIIYQNSIEEYTLAGNKTHPHLEYLDNSFKLKSIEVVGRHKTLFIYWEYALKYQQNGKDLFWFSLIAIAILAFSSIPFWVGRSAETDTLLFRGTYFDETDYAVHISMMQAGRMGDWTYQMRFTSEEHQPAFLRMFYIILGHISKWINLDVENTFHVARWIFGFIALYSIYKLCTKIFPNQNHARGAFLLSVLGAGAGLAPIDAWRIA